MKKTDPNLAAFYALLRGGLWGTEVRLAECDSVDFNEVYEIAKAQTVVGLVAAGLEQVVDRTITKQDARQYIHHVIKTEGFNKAMNDLIAKLVTYLRDNGVEVLLVKGQGLALCYDRPLWRSVGDVDFMVAPAQYEKAVQALKRVATSVDNERDSDMHISFEMGGWIVELHGTLEVHYIDRVDRVVSEVFRETFERRQVRTWMDGEVPVDIPEPNNDVIFVFTHILKHSFIGGVGLRQICDWCRLLYAFREKIDVSLLQERLLRMGLMREWKTFAAYAVQYLGMSPECIPLYDPSPKWRKKAETLNGYVLLDGNFGQNWDRQDRKHYLKNLFVGIKTFCYHSLRHFVISPRNSLSALFTSIGDLFLRFRNKVKRAFAKKG